MTNYTESRIYTYSEAVADESLPLTNVTLSDGREAVNVYKLYSEGEYSTTFISFRSAMLLDYSKEDGLIYRCNFSVRDAMLVKLGILQHIDDEIIPFHNIAVVKISEDHYNSFNGDINPLLINFLRCTPYNGNTSTLGYYPDVYSNVSFVRNILLNDTVDVMPTTTVALPTSTMAMTTTTIVPTPEVTSVVTDITTNPGTENKLNNGGITTSDAIFLAIGTLIFLFTTITGFIILIFSTKRCEGNRMKISQFLGREYKDTQTKSTNKLATSTV